VSLAALWAGLAIWRVAQTGSLAFATLATAALWNLLVIGRLIAPARSRSFAAWATGAAR
jgi:hypothetical protein